VNGHAKSQLLRLHKARVCLIHQDNRERGLNAVKLLLEHLGDVQRCTTLVKELPPKARRQSTRDPLAAPQFRPRVIILA
jgi:hypothetical protein